MSKRLKRTVFLLAICVVYMPGTAAAAVNEDTQAVAASVVSAAGSTSPSQPEQNPNVEWFKRELRISPKYAEETQGIFGLSWAHFMTMVFLVLFFVLGLVALLIRYKRTQELLKVILEEKKDEGKS
jgi:disulfide bond formation protein DsbB